MGTVRDVLEIAGAEVGYSRYADPQAGTKYGRWYATIGGSYYAESGVPYCAMFASWVLDQAGVACAGLPGAYCPDMLEAARRAGATVALADAEPGDLIYYDWNGDGESDHVGIVVKNYGGANFETIEGNTSGNAAGSQTNGGMVARRSRPAAYVCGIVRPDYSGTGSQANGTKAGLLDVDGWVGPLTVRAWQEQLGTTEDGEISGQMAEYAPLFPRASAMAYGGGGSELMQAVQGRIGVPHPTGIAAQATVRLLQGWLILRGYEIDPEEGGVLGESTAKALQRSINAKEWL